MTSGSWEYPRRTSATSETSVLLPLAWMPETTMRTRGRFRRREVPRQSRTRSAHAATAPAAATLSESTPPAHRDPDREVDGGQRAPGQAVTLGAEHEGQPLGRVRGQDVQAHRVALEGEGRGREAQVAQLLHAPGPRVDAGPRDLEDRPHRDADRASVERVGAPRGDEHRIHAQRRGAAEHRPDVGVVDHVLEDEHAAGALQDLGEGREHGRCIAASAPRWRWKPVSDSMTSCSPTNTWMPSASAAATRSARSVSQRSAMR